MENFNRVDLLSKYPNLLQVLEIDLFNKEIENLDETIFSDLINLREINLSNNKITLIYPNIFR